MRYKIESVNYPTSNALIETYPCLKDFGFEIEKKVYPKTTKIKDDEGKELIFEYGSKTIYTPYIYIYGLDELNKLIKAVDAPLIIDEDEGQHIIEIYDGWRE